MKIIHVAQFLGIGGLEKIVYHLALEQKAQGHDVQIYIYDYEQTWVPFFRENGLTVITPIIKKKGYDFTLLKRMNNDLYSADIIHSHDLNPLMYLAPLKIIRKLFRLKNPKLIHTTHGLDHISQFKRARLYQNIVSRIADNVVAVSTKIEKFYKEDLKINPKKVILIENGIATYQGIIDQDLREQKKKWLVQKHQLNIQLPIVISLSRIVPLKDQLFLINAFKKRPGLQLLIAGPPTDQKYFEILEKEIKGYSNIQLIGSQELIFDYHLGSDLYVSSSTHEGIPVAVLEAMAVETPVLISNIPGHLTLNQYSNCVNVFTLHDQNDFLLKCDQIITQNEKYLELGKESRKIVEQHFSVKNMVKKYINLYKFNGELF